MKSIRELFFLGIDHLEKEHIEAPRRSMEHLLCHFLKLDRMELYMQFDRPLVENEIAAIRSGLKRRAKGEPTAYIEGSLSFMGCDIKVTPAALIPRPETEWIAEEIIKELKNIDLKGKILFDIGTGSGCLAIAIKKHLPDLDVYASDVSTEALLLAQENAALNQAPITFLEGDLLAPYKNLKPDFIVANLPYIATQDEISREVSDFEPTTALFSGPDGLDHYRALEKQIQALEAPLKIWLEIGNSQGPAINKLFNGCGSLFLDYAGHSRLFSLEKALVKEVL